MIGIAIIAGLFGPVDAYASEAPVLQTETPDYKVAFFESSCYHMQDENGKRSGYGYELMEGIAKYLQCTFSYVGYDKTAAESVEMLRNGEVDLYTAAKRTPEREAEFVFSSHPSITTTTCMNVKVGNTSVIAGDYSTYEGLRIGLLERHTYNEKFLGWVKEKGFSCEIVYYDTPTELSNALINDEVDALVNSYSGTPEDERMVEDFGQTPYYIMARKEDQELITRLDAAIDAMNIETPNWRTDLYNKYYGSQDQNTELTPQEQEFLTQMQEQNVVVRAVMNPDENPYSWYEDGEAHGIVADLFRAAINRLQLDYEIVQVSSRKEYQEMITSGEVDVWMDLAGSYDEDDPWKYKVTNPYLSTTVSVLRKRGASEKIHDLAIVEDGIDVREIISANWPDAEVTEVADCEQGVQEIVNGNVDGMLLMTYTAQKLARDDVQNRLRVDIVPGASLSLQMGVNAYDNYLFYGIWEKTLANVADEIGAEVVQSYNEETAAPTMLAYLFDNPVYLLMLIVGILLLISLILLYAQSVHSKHKQQKISEELADALQKAEEANESKQNFFSKMSHDIRTPLNVVLGMTQIAQKYKYDVPRLENALDSITSEGNYLLVLINSILDVNQLEHGHVELLHEPFNPVTCVRNSVEMLRPLAEKKEQQYTVQYDCEDQVVLGDANRFSQIMINIISNAIKYTNSGGAIQVKFEALPDHRYRFSCKDNGIGMSEEFVKHIYEDYARAEDSRVSKVQGTGLGMSVVKGFTDLMNGTLDLHSEQGKGSTFIVEIPFEPASDEQTEAVLHPSPETDVKVRLERKKVLLVEDNSLNAEIAMELLQSIGLSIDWAENGAIGVEQFKASAPGEYLAIFMDMQMPVMDGLEATKQIRNSGHPDCNIPIFAMTANTFASDREKCREAGMNGHISKPIHVTEIESALETLFKD